MAIQKFEEFYKSRQNCGLDQIDKNKDLVMVKALFACWDPDRLGHITVEVLTENLIGFGLSVSQDQVDKLLAALNLHPDEPKKRVEDITLNNFVKIFDRDAFGDKATEIIKNECI